MLRRHAPWGDYDDRGYFGRGYFDRGWPPPSLMEVRARWLVWLWRLALAGGFLALASYVVSHDDPRPGLADRSWLTLGLAAALVGLLSVHRLAGVVPLLRALAEYGVVALLVVLLAVPGTAPSGHQQAAKSPAHQADRAGKRATTAGTKAAHGCPPVRQVPAWVACLWRQAQQAHPPTKPKALSPAPSTRRIP